MNRDDRKGGGNLTRGSSSGREVDPRPPTKQSCRDAEQGWVGRWTTNGASETFEESFRKDFGAPDPFRNRAGREHSGEFRHIP